MTNCSYYLPHLPQESSPAFSVVNEKTADSLMTDSGVALAYSLQIHDPIPTGLATKIQQALESQIVQLNADTQIQYTSDSRQVLGEWIYVAATAFSSLEDEISAVQIQRLWQGSPMDDTWTNLYVLKEDIEILSLLFGEASSTYVIPIKPEDALQTAWREPSALFILPFEEISPRWKILQFDGVSIFSRPFDSQSYPLSIYYIYSSSTPISLNKATELPLTNFDPQKMTTVLMTGVTALTRATGAKMESEGMTYPASSIREVLLDADITHISNEVSFAEDCPPADPHQVSVMFCSRPEYFDLLTSIEVDVVELSGNHLMDWSVKAFSDSLTLYENAGMGIYAGGINQTAARQPYKISLNGNHLAFLGCNPAGPPNVWATEDNPGVANCDGEWMLSAVEQLVREGYLPIVTMQHFETYAMQPNPAQKADFLKLSAHGAVIVSGSQAHLPQGMTFVGNHFVHYGLGNLFFDQMDIPVVGTRREFLDRHIFYEGNYIQTELFTTLLEDYARPRLMTDEERDLFLTDIFTASGWYDRRIE
jgi:poly-gamma-glutamate synthesis protein (capsule biosynthesis protein)